MALNSSHIQPNSPLVWNWLIFDLDHDDAYFTAEEKDCPTPNFVSVNRENGHAHIGYLLAEPVSAFGGSRHRPKNYFAMVERGLARKLGADPRYAGFICKNPVHPRWETHWMGGLPYDLDRLNDFLDDNLRRQASLVESAIGRNVSIFDSLRQYAYKTVCRLKKDGWTEAQFQSHLERVANHHNSKFTPPLDYREVKGIAKSVSKWVWQRFEIGRSSAAASELARRRVAKRWANHEPTIKPAWPRKKASLSANI